MSVLMIIVALHAVSTFAMLGLIWFVQLVHYPLFDRVGAAGFAVYESNHQRRTTWVVAPLMGVEALTAVTLILLVDGGWLRVAAMLGVALVAGLWLSTWLLQVPCHRRLSAGYDSSVTRTLVTTNWLRTIMWTCRATIAVVLILAVET